MRFYIANHPPIDGYPTQTNLKSLAMGVVAASGTLWQTTSGAPARMELTYAGGENNDYCSTTD